MPALTFNQALEAEAIKRIDIVIQGEKNVMAAGQLPDHASYRYHAGIIQGYEKAKEILEETLVDIQKV